MSRSGDHSITNVCARDAVAHQCAVHAVSVFARFHVLQGKKLQEDLKGASAGDITNLKNTISKLLA